jgi:hypothetical protein
LSLLSLWWCAVGVASALAAIVFFAVLGARPDIAAAAETPRFLLKFAITLTLAAGAFAVAFALLRPEGSWRRLWPYLAAAPVLLLLSAIVELAVVPPEMWSAKLVGANALVCLVFIPLIGIGPLGVLLLALRQGAPSRPALAGAAAGLLAGGIAASFYAAHCTDDSPLFVATWYSLAIGGLALAGAAGAHRFARW